MSTAADRDDPDSPTRARVGKVPQSVEERVEECMFLMRAMQWEKGKTGERLAAEWGCNPKRVTEAAAEASRRVKAEALAAANKDQARDNVCASMARIAAKAERERNYTAAVAAGRAWTEILGAQAPKRVQEVPPEPEDAKTRRAKLRAALAALESGDEEP